MKRTNIWLSLFAVLAGTVSAWAGETGHKQGVTNSVGHTTHVGDLSDDVRKPPAPSRLASHKKQSFVSNCNTSCDSSCDAMCDDGCDSMAGGGGSCLAGILGGKKSSKGSAANNGAWGRIDTLLWWTEDRDSPALISTTPNFGDPAFIPGGGTVLFGGENGLESGLLFGNRIDFGKYFGSDETCGLGARIFGIWNGDETVSYVSDGTGPSIGVPFFDVADTPNTGVAVGTFGFLPIGQDLGGGLVVTGDITGESSLELIASEVYGRTLLARTSDLRLDMVGGYTFHRLEDTVRLSGTSVLNNTVINQLVPLNSYSFSDRFAATNTFHGGQIGFETQIVSNRIMFSALTKVHLGNMNQRVRLDGNSSFDNLPGVTTNNNRGLLIQGTEGLYERDVFAFAPEANIKMGYRVTQCATLNVGYSLLMWSDIALAGDHIDNRIDGERTLANLNVPLRTDVPNFTYNTDSFFIHGLDLGITFMY
ncbi:MAG: BBP7 family outer membrane beta-barrel protein [Pirellulaceae bacterium]